MIVVSNYPDKARRGQFRLLVKFTGDDLASAQSLFGEERISFEWNAADETPLKLSVDSSSPYRLGKLHTPAKQSPYRTLTLLHRNEWVPVFGTTITREEHFDDKNYVLELDLNLARLKPARAVKRGKKKDPQKASPPNIRLKEAVAAVNAHKLMMGKELCLSIQPDGTLEALLRYS